MGTRVPARAPVVVATEKNLLNARRDRQPLSEDEMIPYQLPPPVQSDDGVQIDDPSLSMHKRGVYPKLAYIQGRQGPQGVQTLVEINKTYIIGELRGKDRYFTLCEYNAIGAIDRAFFYLMDGEKFDLSGAKVPIMMDLEWDDGQERLWVMDCNPRYIAPGAAVSNMFAYVSGLHPSMPHGEVNIELREWKDANRPGSRPLRFEALANLHVGTELVMHNGGRLTNQRNTVDPVLLHQFIDEMIGYYGWEEAELRTSSGWHPAGVIAEVESEEVTLTDRTDNGNLHGSSWDEVHTVFNTCCDKLSRQWQIDMIVSETEAGMYGCVFKKLVDGKVIAERRDMTQMGLQEHLQTEKKIQYVYGYWELFKNSRLVEERVIGGVHILCLRKDTVIGGQISARLENTDFCLLMSADDYYGEGIPDDDNGELQAALARSLEDMQNAGSSSEERRLEGEVPNTKSLRDMHVVMNRIPPLRSQEMKNWYIVLILMHWAHANELPWEAQDTVVKYRLIGDFSLVFRAVRSTIKHPIVQQDFDTLLQNWIKDKAIIKMARRRGADREELCCTVEQYVHHNGKRIIFVNAAENFDPMHGQVHGNRPHFVLIDEVNRIVTARKDTQLFKTVNGQYSPRTSACVVNVKRMTRMFPDLLDIWMAKPPEEELIDAMDHIYKADERTYVVADGDPEPFYWCRHIESKKLDYMRDLTQARENNRLTNQRKRSRGEKEGLLDPSFQPYYALRQIVRSIHWIDERDRPIKERNYERALRCLRLYPDQCDNLDIHTVNVEDLQQLQSFCTQNNLRVFTITGDLDRITVIACQWLGSRIHRLLNEAFRFPQVRIEQLVNDVRTMCSQWLRNYGTPCSPAGVPDRIREALNEPNPRSKNRRRVEFGKVLKHLASTKKSAKHIERAVQLLNEMK